MTTETLFTVSCTPDQVWQATMAFAKHCPHELSIAALKRETELRAQLTSDQWTAALLRALALLDALIVQAEQKQMDFETALGLLEMGIIPDAVYDAAATEIISIRRGLDQTLPARFRSSIVEDFIDAGLLN